MKKNLWIGLLMALAAIELGVILVADNRPQPAKPPTASPGPMRPVVQTPTTPGFDSMLPPESGGGDSTPRPDALSGSERAGIAPATIQEADYRPPANFELPADFSAKVRQLADAGVDPVLLAHAVVAQMHRQGDAVRSEVSRQPGLPPNWYMQFSATQEDARQRAVTSLLGAEAYAGWRRSDFLMSRQLWGAGLTDAQTDAVMTAHRDQQQQLTELNRALSSGQITREDYSRSTASITAETSSRITEALGAELAAKLRLY